MILTFDYNLDDYTKDLDELGLNGVWDNILNSIKHKDEQYGIVCLKNFGELYEIGLAHVNKVSKKEHGKYFTPNDVAKVMGRWFIGLKGSNVCDVCCGVGNLILTYLSILPKLDVHSLLINDRLYLYDQDELALKICVKSICLTYGMEYESHIHKVVGDFLDRNVTLPNDAKVISNPPYFKITAIPSNWDVTNVVYDSKELYSAIMEKVMNNSEASVFITPYSFLGGEKFQSLREKMNDHNGFIVTFDNKPGNIFNGRKHGIFNSSTKNDVRASITVVEDLPNVNGFKCSGMIRFKGEERKELLDNNVLESLLSREYQFLSSSHPKYAKLNKGLEGAYDALYGYCDETLNDHLPKEGDYSLCFPNTCRYYTVGTIKDLERDGKYNLWFKDEEVRDIAYAWMNSSFAYWHWRLFDGGIVYQKGLLKEMPFPISRMARKVKDELIAIAKEMQDVEGKYIKLRKNAGSMQENVKFPIEYRDRINSIIVKSLGCVIDKQTLESIHSRAALVNEFID